jgi:hypothetical protein
MTPATIAVGALIVSFGALIVFETTVLRSRSSSIELLAAAMPPAQELDAMVGDGDQRQCRNSENSADAHARLLAGRAHAEVICACISSVR